MHPTPKQMILGLCVFSLSLIAIACLPKTKDGKESITVNTPLASVPTNEDAFGIYGYLNQADDEFVCETIGNCGN